MAQRSATIWGPFAILLVHVTVAGHQEKRILPLQLLFLVIPLTRANRQRNMTRGSFFITLSITLFLRLRINIMEHEDTDKVMEIISKLSTQLEIIPN